jgi:thymidylate synthase (FAD)
MSGDGLAETAGRACYWSYGKGRKGNDAYLGNIIASGHGSVLEHPHWTFGIMGISRTLSHELVRHRHLCFSQLSQRFVTEEPEFVVPPKLLEDKPARFAFEQSCSAAAEAYRTLLKQLPDDKSGREAARSVLPGATATRIVVTGNGRALRHVLTLRGSLGADAEFRRLACQWLAIMKQEAPNIFQDMEVQDGHVTCQHQHV